MFRFFNRRSDANRTVATRVAPPAMQESSEIQSEDGAVAVLDPAGRNYGRRKSDRENVLTVGGNISLKGRVSGCAMLYVEGDADVKVSDCGALVVSETGRFHGKARVESAEIAGMMTGDVVCTGRLILRSTGHIKGKIRYGELEIETGGSLGGNIEALSAKERTGAGEEFFGLVRYS
jgi:cytoskeletal protein CcmA (bactofilin family)